MECVGAPSVDVRASQVAEQRNVGRKKLDGQDEPTRVRPYNATSDEQDERLNSQYRQNRFAHTAVMSLSQWLAMLDQKLRKLRLGHAASVLEAHHQAAINAELGYLEFL